MSVIVDIVNAITDVYDVVQKFFTEDLYHLLTQFIAWCIKWAAVAYWKLKLSALSFAYDVASSLQLSQYLQSFWGALDGRIASMMQFFRIPEAINIILSGFFTKFVFRFLGF
jgi:hypothetical protein